jgi:hypothetical protein
MVTQANIHAHGDDDDDVIDNDDKNNHYSIDVGDDNQHTERLNSIIVDQVDIIPTVQGIYYDMIYE